VKSLSELIKTISTISQDRYSGDFSIARIENLWKVSFRRKIATGFTWVEVAEDSTLEKALNKACDREINKAEEELGKAREFIKKIGSKG